MWPRKSFGKRSQARRQSTRNQRSRRNALRARRTMMEPLEERTMLSVAPPFAPLPVDNAPMLEGFDGVLELDGDSPESGTRARVFDIFNGTWADAEKDATSSEDDLLCWAATASNMLEWTGWGMAGGMYKADQMLDYFENHWDDDGGFTNNGTTWWMDGAGDYAGEVDVAGGGFYPDFDPTTYIDVENTDANVMDFIAAETANGSGMGISIGTSGGGHAITVWGYNYDVGDPDYYQGLWVTDSDDDKAGLADAYTGPNDLHYYDVSWNSTDSRWDFDSYATNFWIGRAYSLDRYDNGIVTLNGDQDSVNQADAFNLTLDSTGMYIEVSINGDLEYTSPKSQVDQLYILGWGGDDTLTVDFTNGDPVPAGGLLFEGGTGGGDALTVVGTGNSIGSYAPAITTGDGVVTVNGSAINFSGLEPVTVSGFNEFTFVTPNSDDSVTIDSPAAGQNRISGTSGGVAFESLTFSGVDALPPRHGHQ